MSVKISSAAIATATLAADRPRSIKQVLIIEMCLARGRFMICLAKQMSDRGRRFLADGGIAGGSVTQIVFARFAKVGALKDRRPEVIDPADRPTAMIFPEQP